MLIYLINCFHHQNATSIPPHLNRKETAVAYGMLLINSDCDIIHKLRLRVVLQQNAADWYGVGFNTTPDEVLTDTRRCTASRSNIVTQRA